MAIWPDMVVKLKDELIKDADDLDMFYKDLLKQLTDNLKCSAEQTNVVVVMVETAAFKFGAKSQMILEATSNPLRFYKTVGRSITNNIIQWDSIIKDFKQE